MTRDESFKQQFRTENVNIFFFTKASYYSDHFFFHDQNGETRKANIISLYGNLSNKSNRKINHYPLFVTNADILPLIEPDGKSSKWFEMSHASFAQL